MFSPIAYFAYKRPTHTKHSLEALSKNKESISTDLFVFIDGHKDEKEIPDIDQVEAIIRSFKDKFKSLNIERHSFNKGTAKNTIEGITSILSKFETVIDIEDDIFVSDSFLEYMNNSLERYKSDEKVWHINGYNFQIQFKSDSECIFLRNMICWGWGTWKDKWSQFIAKPEFLDPIYLEKNISKKQRNYMDMDLSFSPNWSQIKLNERSKISTWAIFWYCFIVSNKGLCLTPKYSLVRNIGHDNSGENCGISVDLQNSKLSNIKITKFPDSFNENEKAYQAIRDFYKKEFGLKKKIKRKLYNFFLMFKKYLDSLFS